MTAPVKRYNMDVGKFGNVDAYESEHGRWVKRDDYDRLEQECERLRDLLTRVSSSYKALLTDCGLKHTNLIAEIDAALQAKP